MGTVSEQSRRSDNRGRIAPPQVVFGALLALSSTKVGVITAVVAGFGPAMLAYKTLVAVGLCAALWTLAARIGGAPALVAVWVVQTMYLGAHLLYHASFGVHLSLAVAGTMLGEAVGVLREGGVPWQPWELVLLVVDAPLLLAAARRGGDIRRHLRHSRKTLPITVALLVVSMAGPTFFWLRGESIPFLIEDRWSGETRIVKRFGLLAANATELWLWAGGERPEDGVMRGPIARRPGRSGPAPDIFVIQMESIGANVIGLKHRGRPVAPFLTELSRRSVYYPFAVTYHGAGASSDAEFAALNGTEPLPRYPSLKMPSYRYPDSIVRALRDQGYAAVAFHGNFGSYFNRDVAFRKMGFHRFLDMEALGLEQVVWGADDEELFAAVVESIPAWPRPVFAYVITMSSHEPYIYLPPEATPGTFSDVAPEDVRRFYRSVAYLDSRLRSFVTELRRRRPEAWIVLFGDHTPFILDEGYRVARVEPGAYSAELVPLIISGPGIQPYRERHRAASVMDVGPTVLGIAGVPYELRTWGTDLLRIPIGDETLIKAGRRRDRRLIYRAATRTRP